MTPAELYPYDVNGYLLIEDAIESDYLTYLNERLDVWEEKALARFFTPCQNRQILKSDTTTF